MPGVDYSQPLASASASAATDWASVAAGTAVELKAAGELNRGINLDLGIMGMASIDAALSKFLTAEVTGEAHAAASLCGQIQMPMNLFDEMGLAVRLEAIAELAAGVEGSLGISIGDFVALVEHTPGMAGIPTTLLRIFLEEITLDAGVYAKASLSAMAYVNFVITGSAIGDQTRGIDPGFTITVGKGAGLKAGAGFRATANLGVENFSRLFSRSADVLIDEVIDIARACVTDDPNLDTLLCASRAPAKIGLRLAYELGEFLATEAPATNAAGTNGLCLRAVQVVLEEAQRYLLRSIVELGLDRIVELADAHRGDSSWAAALSERTALAEALAQRPQRPYELTAEIVPFWASVTARTTDLLAALGLANDTSRRKDVAATWAAVHLLASLFQQVTTVQGRATVVGLPPLQASTSFSGPLTVQPPPAVDRAIRDEFASRGTPVSGQLTKTHLLNFIADRALMDAVTTSVPGVRAFLDPMVGPLGTTASHVALALLTNIGPIVSQGGAPDSRATLEALLSALDHLTFDLIETQLAPPLRARLGASPDARIMLDEVLLPSLHFSVATALRQVAKWDQGAATSSQLTEALSGVVMRVFGRSLVAVGDVFMACAQDGMADILNEVADSLDQPGGIVAVLEQAVGGAIDVDDIADLVSDALRVGAEVFGPLDADTRATLRRCMYEIIDMIPPDADEAFLAELADGRFMPRYEPMMRMAGVLAEVGVERFLLFVEGFLIRLAGRLLEELAEFVVAAAEQVIAWINGVFSAIAEATQRLLELAAEMAQLAAEAVEHFAASGERLLESVATLSSSSARNRMVDRLVDQTVDGVIDALKDSGLWGLISWNADLRRSARATAKAALREVLKSDIVDAILDGVGGVAQHLDDILDDVRELDPDRPLAGQLTEMILDRLEETVDSAIGNSVEFRVRFSVDFGEIYRGTVNLGKFRLDIGPILDVARDVARGLDGLEDAIRDAAAALEAAFTAEAALADREREHDAVGTEKRRLEQYATEATPGVLGLEILSPTVGAVVDGPSHIEIKVTGLPASILESGNGVPPRMHVLLNGVGLDVDALQVTEHESVSLPNLSNLIEIPDGLRATLPFTQQVTTTGLSAGLGRLGPLSADDVRPGTKRTDANKAPAPATAFPIGRQAGRVRQAQPSRSGGDPGLPSLGRIGAGTARGMGRTVPPSVKRRASPSHALIVQRSLLPGHLVDGLNTLAVVVIAPSGERLTDAVTFLGEAALSESPPPKPAEQKRPGRDTPRTEIPNRRTHPPALLEPADKGDPRLPRARVDRRMLVPKKLADSASQLALPPQAQRRTQARELMRAVQKTKVDPSRGLRAASPTIAARPRIPVDSVFPLVAAYAPRLPRPQPDTSSLQPDPLTDRQDPRPKTKAKQAPTDPT